MSIQAMVWALEDAPDVPPNLVGVLSGLANHADADGRGAYPPVDRLAYYSRKAHRQVQNDLKKLRELKLISLGDQRLVAHIDPRYRPVVYDLAMHRRRPRYVRTTTAPEQDPAPIPSSDAPHNTPDQSRGAADDTQGCTPASPGVQQAAPKPSVNRPSTPPPPPPPATHQPETRGGGEPATAYDPLTAAVDATLHHQPRWRRNSVLAALKQAIAEGLDTAVACKIMPELAEGSKYGPTTAGPQRILARGPWWVPGEVFIPSETPTKRCQKHPGEPKHNCRCCAGERNAVKPDTKPAAPAAPVELSTETAQKLNELSGGKYRFRRSSALGSVLAGAK